MRPDDRETKTRTERAGKVLAIIITGEVAVAPAAVIDLVTDFSDRRGEVFPAVSAKRTTVHSIGDTNADVYEGTRAGPFVFWERCDYDWSQPGRVVANVTSSNVYAIPESEWELTAQPSGAGSTVTVTWRRRFRKHPLGRFMGFVYRTQGKRLFTQYAREVMENLEARVAANP
jgi:hypothetical protein